MPPPAVGVAERTGTIVDSLAFRWFRCGIVVSVRTESTNTVRRHGSTLLELLIALALLAILAGLTIAALNPRKNFADASDAKRREDLRTMIDALYQYQIDYDRFPKIDLHATLDTQHRDICSVTESDLFYCLFDTPQRLPLGPLIPNYLAELPHDPENTEEYETGYQLWLDEAGRIHAYAPLGSGGQGIEVAR